ncbi:MAG: hypothetical protein NVS1B13_06200 [Flavisolibacter sp.]
MAFLLFFWSAFTQNIQFNLASSAESHGVTAENPVSGHVYHWKRGVDRPITYAGLAWSGYALTKIYSKSPSTVQQIQTLDRNNLIAFNRGGTNVYSEKAVRASNLFFYGSMPIPLLLLADKDIRKDAGRVGSIYAEAIAVTGLLYTASVYFVDKYRPLAYNPDVPIDTRTRGGAKNSFFAGHVALVGTSTLFFAKVYADYHPHSPKNILFYALAIGATGTTAYLRYRGGQHFLTDIIIGGGLGVFSGVLIPQFHKNKGNYPSRLSLSPYSGLSNGIALRYKL